MLIIADEKEVRFLNNKCNPCTTTIYFELFLFLSTGCFHFIDASLLSRKRSIPRWIKGAFSMRSFYLPFTLSIPSLNFKNHYLKYAATVFQFLSYDYHGWLYLDMRCIFYYFTCSKIEISYQACLCKRWNRRLMECNDRGELWTLFLRVSTKLKLWIKGQFI